MHSAGEWDNVLKSVVSRYLGKVSRISFRAEASFPEVYERLEAGGRMWRDPKPVENRGDPFRKRHL